MPKKEIRQRLKETGEIIDLWLRFNNLIKSAQAKKGASEEEETEFLRIKTELARKQRSIADTPLKLMNIMAQATTLADMARFGEIDARKFYTDWHETYLSLNELLGMLKSGRAGLAAAVKQKTRSGCRGCLYNFILFIILIVISCIGFRIYDKKYDLKNKIKETAAWNWIIDRLEKFVEKDAGAPEEKTKKGGKQKSND